ncbi:MAG TPA: hypothetical protein VLV83_27040 [Acidobacteriota bacterium]|nr:hypothetical protein [Acidobacteriota bacterium]
MASRGIVFIFSLLLILPAAGGCSRNFNNDPDAQVPSDARQLNPRQPASPADETPLETAPQTGESVELPGIAYTLPDGWIPEAASGSFRVAQYRLPSDIEGQEAGEMVVFYFQGGGGGVQANIDRWIGMFSMPDGSDPASAAQVGKAASNGIPLTTLDIAGTYNKSIGPPMAGNKQPFPGYRMLAAVAETQAGPYFFRLTGPVATVGKWEESFQQFLQNLRPNP